MKHTTFGLFSDSQAAGEAVAELEQAKYTDAISLVTRKEDDEGLGTKVETHNIKQKIDPAAPVTGGLAGAAVGALGALLATAVPVTVAGVGALLVGGPLTALVGAAVGAGSGALIGTLVDLGMPDDKAQMYQHRVFEGEVLVAVTTDAEDEFDVESVLLRHGADEVTTLHNP